MVDEIRLHHVFEHFARPQACALLVARRSWLKPGGTLRIEVPDVNRTALAMLNPASGLRGECVGARHLFGSNEAPWAIHLEGCTTRRLSLILRTLGYRVMGVRHNHWRRTYNLEAFAERLTEDLSDDEAKGRVQAFLALFLVGQSESAILRVWLGDYERQLARCAAPTTAATGDSSGGKERGRFASHGVRYPNRLPESGRARKYRMTRAWWSLWVEAPRVSRGTHGQWGAG